MNANVDETLDVEVKRAPERAKSFYELRRIRTGKTKRDHASGAWKRRMDNGALRAAWRNQGPQGRDPFPTHTARGLGNSSKRFKVKPGKAIN